MSFFKKLFRSNDHKDVYEPKITIEKIKHIFEYGKLKNLVGTGSPELSNLKLGTIINWSSESKFRKAYKDIPEQIVPPHIQWSNNPLFAYVGIVDHKVKYHYGENGQSAIYICPQTTDDYHLKLIDVIFEHYYQNFDLPNSLSNGKVRKEKVDRSDKMKFLSAYLTTEDGNFFQDNCCEDEDVSDLAMWIDWREEDENIIVYCEKILQTNQLFAATQNAENESGFETIIFYKGQPTAIPYRGLGADRSTTIKALNNAVKADYEIRLFKESAGSDTLCLLPLGSQ
jgi:hypothetical protein